MTEHEQNRAIAEALGYHDFWEGFAKFKDEARRGPIPDYYSSLDAMKEAEDALAFEDAWLYCYELGKVLGFKNRNDWIVFDMLNAAAHYRAEAWLRTKGLWKD